MAKLTAAEKKLLEKLLAGLPDDEKEALVKPTKKAQAQRQANFKLGKRPNTFEKSADFTKFKSDTETDKLLWGHNTPEARDRVSKVMSTCSFCGAREEVSVVLVYKDDKGKTQHTCDQCTK